MALVHASVAVAAKITEEGGGGKVGMWLSP